MATTPKDPEPARLPQELIDAVISAIYESSDEEAHNRRAHGSSSNATRNYINVSDDDEPRSPPKQGLLDEEDPFADPFVDPEDEGATPSVELQHGMKW